MYFVKVQHADGDTLRAFQAVFIDGARYDVIECRVARHEVMPRAKDPEEGSGDYLKQRRACAEDPGGPGARGKLLNALSESALNGNLTAVQNGF